LEAIAPLGYLEEDFRTEYFDYIGETPLWIFSNWIDGGMRLFRHNASGITIPCHTPRNDREKAVYEDVLNYIQAQFSPFDYDEIEFKKTLNMVFSRIPHHGLMFVLLSLESDKRPNRRRAQRNRWCVEVASSYPNVRPLRMGDFIEGDSEILNTNSSHYDRKVYYRLYQRLVADANAHRAEQ
jgi:hypothetical protein